MSAHVLLNLLNELGKRDKMQGFSSVIQDFVFSSRKKGCIRCISLQVYNKCIFIWTLNHGVIEELYCV